MVAAWAGYPAEIEMGSDGLRSVELPEGDAVQVLAVAQAADDGTERGRYQPKGWKELRLITVAGPPGCGASADADADGEGDGGGDAAAGEDGREAEDDGDAAQPEGDAAHEDGGADAAGPPGDDGCECSAPGAPPDGRFGAAEIVLAALAAGLRRRRRGRP